MTEDAPMRVAQIVADGQTSSVLALGCWTFGGAQWGGQEDSDSLATMETALRCGINHFDTAEGYGRGRSEQVVGRFLQDRREEVFLATKGLPDDPTAEDIQRKIDASCQRLGTDVIDLYYIHWPRKGRDMRPVMEGLEAARRRGKVQAVGVSNFSVQQMREVAEVGRIDAHQLCYNLFWRFPEREIIPYCKENDIAVITYSSIAQGILTGKFPSSPTFAKGDSRARMVLFDEEVWPHVYGGVRQLKGLAEEVSRPLLHLAIRWVADQPTVNSVLVGARKPEQAKDNAAAMKGEIPQEVFDRMTQVSDEVMQNVPDVGNIFRFYP